MSKSKIESITDLSSLLSFEIYLNNKSENYILFPDIIEEYLTERDHLEWYLTLPIGNTLLHEAVLWGIKYSTYVYNKENISTCNFNIHITKFNFKKNLHENDLVAFITSIQFFKTINFKPKELPYFDTYVFVFPFKTEAIPIGLYSYNEIEKLFCDIHDEKKRTYLIEEFKKKYIEKTIEYNKKRN